MAASTRTLPRKGAQTAGTEAAAGVQAWLGRGWGIAAGLLALHLLLALLAFDPTPHTGGDNAAYIALGRSLLERGAYLELYDPATPPHTQYPPAFPALLALAQAVGITSWVGFKLIVVACSALAVGAAYFWMRRRAGGGAALAVGVLLAASPSVLDLSHWVLSDVPFWALTMLALWGYDALEPGERRRGALALAVAATVLAYFTRSAGLPLALAAGGWLLLRRRWRDLAILALALLPLALAWWVRARAYGGVDYVNQFWWIDPYTPELGRIGLGALVERIIDNSVRYATVHLPLLLVGRVGAGVVALSGALIALALVGWGRRLRRPGVAEFFFPLYLGLILVWPAVWSGERFLLPAYPLFLAYGAEALAWAADRVRAGASLPVGAVAMALVLLVALPAVSQEAGRGMTCSALYRTGERYPCLTPEWRDFYGLAEWAKGALPVDAVIVSRKPRLFYGLSGLKGRIYPLSEDPARFWAMAGEVGAEYVIFDQLGGLSTRYLGPVIAAQPARFCTLALAPGGTAALLGIVPEGEATADAESAGGRFAPCPERYRRPLPR